ncbi:MAG: hypothetical protein M5U28_00265 [Sandaracinaceae bacterium]|nr:hypothetical protein [Sandaracinaceae bacterium]
MTRYSAPFAPEGPAPIDEQIAHRLLAAALDKGGDYADLFFEYNVTGSYSFEDGILKAAGRSVSTGLGVRVRKGEATGYAYVEDPPPRRCCARRAPPRRSRTVAARRRPSASPRSTSRTATRSRSSRSTSRAKRSARCSSAPIAPRTRRTRASPAWRRPSPSRSARS